MKSDMEDAFKEKYGHFFDVSDLATPQRNLASFMKSLLVQRFESSKYAFKSTLTKIHHSNEMIVKWWEAKGMVPIPKITNHRTHENNCYYNTILDCFPDDRHSKPEI